ncbi:hypothetical protein AB0E59_42125 [Lentzea sp. NPDC034063]|uniref:hypothetical protein n=1 Tax=unclassified Lentzea TaxID=2643253 RepID=UPI0034076898
MDALVQQLCTAEHDITASRIGSVDELRGSLGRGYLLLEFEGTRGGTELGVRLDDEAVNHAANDLDREAAVVRLTGGLRLNQVDVRCVAELNVETMRGTGRLTVVEP